MEDIKGLTLHLKNISKKVIDDLAEAQRDTAEDICQDAKSLAPGSGKYKDSIRVTDTVISGKKITTKIITDVTVTAKSNGNVYNLGALLENGTMPHAIPNAFGWGDLFGYDSDMYKRTLDPNWHPGFVSMPHFIPALNKNKSKYIINLTKAMNKEFK